MYQKEDIPKRTEVREGQTHHREKKTNGGGKYAAMGTVTR